MGSQVFPCQLEANELIIAHLLYLEVFLPMCSSTVTRLARVSAFLASFSYASCTAATEVRLQRIYGLICILLARMHTSSRAQNMSTVCLKHRQAEKQFL